MRKRSEVKAAKQTTIDDARGMSEEPKTGDFVLCAAEVNGMPCGTRMTKQAAKDNEGECVRCGAKLADGSVRARARTEPSEPDPWELTPAGQRKADADRAAAKDSPKQVVAGTDEEPMSILCKRLENRGYRISLIDLAGRTPEERKLAVEWADGSGRFPQWLAKFEDKSIAAGGHKNAVPQPQEATLPYSPPAGSQAAASMQAVPDPTQGISYTWGMEKITPIKGSFSTCEVGPFSAMGHVRAGETIPQAYRRLAKEVTQAAEEERDRKLQSFMRKLMAVAKQVSEPAGG